MNTTVFKILLLLSCPAEELENLEFEAKICETTVEQMILDEVRERVGMQVKVSVEREEITS